MRRDRITFAMMLGVPLIQLLLFGFAINNDPKALPSGAGHRQPRPVQPRDDLGAGADRLLPLRRMSPAAPPRPRTLITRGEVAFVVTIPSDFGARVVRGDRPQILVEADATDPAAASGAIATLGTVAVAGAAARHRRGGGGGRGRGAAQLEVVVHRRYNPEGISQYNIVPGLLGVILQMTMVMMTSMALTRETERGTMENLLAMPATATEVMLAQDPALPRASARCR